MSKDKTYISKLIPKDLLPLLLQQLWWKGFDEAQKKFPNEDASNVAVRRLIKGMFTEFDVDAIRKQITEILNNSFGDSTHFIESNNLCVDRILEVTLGRKQ